MLRDQGLQPGDRIAVAGFALESYYAHVTATPIAAQVMDIGQLAALTDDGLAAVADTLGSRLIRAIVAGTCRTACRKPAGDTLTFRMVRSWEST